MNRYIWLVLLAIPPCIAAEVDAPKWVIVVLALAFFLHAAMLGDDPDEYLLGEGFSKYRSPILLVIVAAGFILAGALFVAFRAVMPR